MLRVDKAVAVVIIFSSAGRQSIHRTLQESGSTKREWLPLSSCMVIILKYLSYSKPRRVPLVDVPYGYKILYGLPADFTVNGARIRGKGFQDYHWVNIRK
jgi:hypothetical protein